MTTETQEEQFQKIIFPLERDEDGYPPADLESLWGLTLNDNLFQIDNIPFFIKGISLKDVVAVQKVESDLYFKEIVQASGHSTVRVIVFDDKQIQPLRQSLRDYGCSNELSHLSVLISVDIPPEIELSKIIAFLAQGMKQEIWEYEEASIRHELPE